MIQRPSGATGVTALALLAALVVVGCGRSAGPSPRSSPVTTDLPTATPGSPAATSARSATLVGAGDIASCDSSGDEATAALLDEIPGTVFTTGDNVYDNGTADEFEHCYDPSWGRARARTRPAPGNHDYHTRGAVGYFDYFGDLAGDDRTGWYAYDLNSWRIYALNSNCGAIGGCGAGSAQEQWLRADLASHPAACVLAYWHHPLFSSSRHGNNPDVRPLFEALYDAGAEIVLGGHDHSYERYAPQAPDGAADSARGLVEIVVGTGGRSHYGFATVGANSLVRDGATFGVLKLTLAEGSYAFEFVPVAGQAFSDSGSGACH